MAYRRLTHTSTYPAVSNRWRRLAQCLMHVFKYVEHVTSYQSCPINCFRSSKVEQWRGRRGESEKSDGEARDDVYVTSKTKQMQSIAIQINSIRSFVSCFLNCRPTVPRNQFRRFSVCFGEWRVHRWILRLLNPSTVRVVRASDEGNEYLYRKKNCQPYSVEGYNPV